MILALFQLKCFTLDWSLCRYIIKNIFTYSFDDVENEKDLDADDKIAETGTNDDEDNADYQRITTIYTAITEYREELRKLQAFQRKDIR